MQVSNTFWKVTAHFPFVFFSFSKRGMSALHAKFNLNGELSTHWVLGPRFELEMRENLGACSKVIVHSV